MMKNFCFDLSSFREISFQVLSLEGMSFHFACTLSAKECQRILPYLTQSYDLLYPQSARKALVLREKDIPYSSSPLDNSSTQRSDFEGDDLFPQELAPREAE